MSLSVNTNTAAHEAHRSLFNNSALLASSIAKLSSGSQFAGGGGNAADLGISEQMQAQISGLGQAQSNTQSGISMLQTASAGLNQASGILQQISDLAVQYNNGINSPANQQAISDQVAQLSAQLDSIGGQTQFNGVSLLSSGGGPITLQTGQDGGETTTLPPTDLASSIGGSIAAFATMAPGGTAPINAIHDAISSVAAAQTGIGAAQTGLSANIANLSVAQENTMAANSSIADVDTAQESTNLAKLQFRQQSITAMLAQANQNSKSVLRLLG